MNSLFLTSKKYCENLEEFLKSGESAGDQLSSAQQKGEDLSQKNFPHWDESTVKSQSFFDKILGRICSVQISLQKDANENSAILAELVFIYEKNLSMQIATMRNQDWFKTNSPILKNLRASPNLYIYRFELTPDNQYLAYFVRVNPKAQSAFLFIRSNDNLESHPLSLNPYKNLKLNFYSVGFTYSQSPEN
jgi:hypothetical protein